MILGPANDKWNNSNHALLRLAGFHFSWSTVQLSLPSKMYMSGLLHHYVAAQLHFHWGSANKPGAEHTLDGEQAVAEVNAANSSVFLLSLEWVSWTIAFQTHKAWHEMSWLKCLDCVQKQQFKWTAQHHEKSTINVWKGSQTEMYELTCKPRPSMSLPFFSFHVLTYIDVCAS